jgi:hypothetical protein
MGSKTINRYVWLLDMLLQKKKLTYEEISNLWEKSFLGDGNPLPLRTFHQHKNAIEEMFGVEIKCNASDGYHYYIGELDNFRKDRTKQWLYNSFTLSNMIIAGHNMKGRILFEDIPHGTQYLQTIIEAMQQNKVLEIDYQPFKGKHNIYHIAPYAMKVYNRRWYVVGKMSEYNEIRHIALDRLIDLAATDISFKMPKNFDAEEYYANTVGIYVNSVLKPQPVRIRVYGDKVDYVRSLPLHKSQEEVQTKNGEYSEFKYKVCLTPELTTQLLSMGEYVQVLEPKELRDKMKERIEKSLQYYWN